MWGPMGHRTAGTAKVQGKLSHVLINVMMSDRIYTRRKSVPGRNDVKKLFYACAFQGEHGKKILDRS